MNKLLLLTVICLYCLVTAGSAVITTQAATGITTKCVQFNGLVTTWGGNVWFEFGTENVRQGYHHAYRTNNITAVDGVPFNYTLCTFPLIANQTYYYEARNATNNGTVVTFTLTNATPHEETNYSVVPMDVINTSGNITEIAGYIWLPYTNILGSIFYALFIGGVFMNLALKQRSVNMSILLVLLVGTSLWSLVPPEFMTITQILFILGLVGSMYWIFTQRRR